MNKLFTYLSKNVHSSFQKFLEVSRLHFFNLKFSFSIHSYYSRNTRIDKFYISALFIAISLIVACSPSTKYVGKNSSIAVDSTITANDKAEQLIKPYKEKLDAEMNEVLVISSEEFPKERGKTQTKLGNLVADLSLEVAQKMYPSNIEFCLLNFGGLRTSLPKGEITRGKIFELMPFENELIVVTISESKFDELCTYLSKSPQPISFFWGSIVISEDNYKLYEDIEVDAEDDPLTLKKIKTYKILTSDYLANGGDNMTFFANPIKTEKVGIKLRDAIIQYCKEQNEKGKQLKGVIDNRIVFEK